MTHEKLIKLQQQKMFLQQISGMWLDVEDYFKLDAIKEIPEAIAAEKAFWALIEKMREDFSPETVGLIRKAEAKLAEIEKHREPDWKKESFQNFPPDFLARIKTKWEKETKPIFEQAQKEFYEL